jgi:hypothetical protein
MATNFPGSLDTLTNPTSSDSLSSPSHSAQHANVNDAVEALQAKVGADSSAVTTSLDYKVAQLEAVSHGKILQVVSTTKTDTFTASVATGATTSVTGLTATITPTSATSTVLVLAQINAIFHSAGAQSVVAVLTRGGTPICVGDANGLNSRGTSSSAGADVEGINSIPVLFLDSPATTSATTYGIDIGHTLTTNNVYVNRSVSVPNTNDVWRTTSTITVMEVGA